MVRPLAMFVLLPAIALVLSGCGEATAPASAAQDSVRAESIDTARAGIIARASFATSPPGHPDIAWPQLAVEIEQAHVELQGLPPLEDPLGPLDPLAERIGSDRVRAIAQARSRALVHRAESARLLARGQPDEAAAELAEILEIAQEVSTWGAPATAEASADQIEFVLDALQQPDGAPLARALTSSGGRALRDALGRLDANDPAGRMRAIVESIAVREKALRSLMDGDDGPALVRAVATRYAPDAELGSTQAIDRSAREAIAFSRALADGWDKTSRSAITNRLRERQDEDLTGVLVVLLGEAPDACDADAALRERIAEMVGRLP